MKFPYTALDGDFERPYVRIAVRHNGLEEAYLTLVDSGADINVFSASLAEDLGIDLRQRRAVTVQGATGHVETFYIHRVTISVAGSSFETEAAFADMPHLDLAGLAGQRGFFDHFRVVFDFAAKEFELTGPGAEQIPRQPRP